MKVSFLKSLKRKLPKAAQSITSSTVARTGILLFALVMPFLYDLAVPEVSGDIRWNANILVSLLIAFLGLWSLRKKGLVLKADLPLIYWFAILFGFWMIVSLADSISIYRAIWPLKFLYAQLILMVGVSQFWKKGWTKPLLWAMAIPVLFTSWLGILQFFGWTDPNFGHMLRESGIFPLEWLGAIWPENGPWNVLLNYYLSSAIPGSSFANKNLAGSYTALMIPLVMMLLVVSKRTWHKLVASIIFALAVLFLVYSRARASWVATAVGMALLAVLVLFVPEWRKAVLHQFSRGFWIAVAPAVILVAMYGNAISPINAHGITMTPGAQMANLYNASWDEVGGRVAYNLNSLAIIRDHWINGTGLGSFYAAYPEYNDAIVSTPTNSYSVTARPQRTHTDFMEMFDELGLVGGLAFLGIFVTAFIMAFRLRHIAANEDLPLTERFFPLFGGVALATLAVNATMDFPMQLPTAPAIVMMVMGVLTWQYRTTYPKQHLSRFTPFKRFKGKSWNLGLVGLILVTLLMVQIGGLAVWDSHKFREAQIPLKQAMIRVMSGVVDDDTKHFIDEAQATYPFDPRVHEHLGVVYANYNGKEALSTADRIKMLEWVVKTDPYGPNQLINLAGQYLSQAETQQLTGDTAGSVKSLARVDDIIARLKKSADFSSYTYGIEGMEDLLRGQPDPAKTAFQKALSIDPTYAPAMNGMKIIEQREAQPAPSQTKPQP